MVIETPVPTAIALPLTGAALGSTMPGRHPISAMLPALALLAVNAMALPAIRRGNDEAMARS